MKPLLTLVLGLTTIIGSASVIADEEQEYAVETRQAILHLVRWNFSPLVGMARDKVPYDAEKAHMHAERLHQLMLMVPDAFTMDTRGYEGDTEALDVIWENKDGFNEKLHNAIQAAIALKDNAGDQAQLPALVGDMGSTCGSCHDDFRVD